MLTKLWLPKSLDNRAALAFVREMLNDQTGTQSPGELQDQMAARYAVDL